MACKSCGGETREGTYKEEGQEYPIWVCNVCGDWGVDESKEVLLVAAE